MSAQSIVYLYNQRETVVLLDHSTAPRRYEKVYSKDLILNKGVDNVIEFVFLNTEQKPIDITDKQIICRILDFDGVKILLETELIHTYAMNGITTLRVSKSELMNIDSQKCFYSLEFIDVNNYPVFVDSLASARGVIHIKDSIYPKFVPSTELTIPSHSSPIPNKSIEYYSSIYIAKQQTVHTFQYTLQDFTGDIILEGSTIPNFTSHYHIETVPYENDSLSHILTVVGNHKYMRIKIKNVGTLVDNSLIGDVTGILVR